MFDVSFRNVRCLSTFSQMLSGIVAIHFVSLCVWGEDTVPPKSVETPTLAAAPADADRPSVLLAYKFQPGQFVHYAATSHVQYVTRIQENTFNALQHNETGTHFRVVTVDDQGVATIEPVVDRTRMSAKMPDKDAVVFDSESGKPAPPQFKAIQEAIGRPVARFQVTANGELVKAIIVDSTVPQSLRESAEKLETRFGFLARLPKTAVKVGDKWREDYSTKVAVGTGLKQYIPIRRIYELTSLTNGIAVVKFNTLLVSTPNDAEIEKQLMQQTPSGSFEFDVERGLIRSHTSTINRTTMNAFGPQSLLQIVGESTEKLVQPKETPEVKS